MQKLFSVVDGVHVTDQVQNLVGVADFVVELTEQEFPQNVFAIQHLRDDCILCIGTVVTPEISIVFPPIPRSLHHYHDSIVAQNSYAVKTSVIASLLFRSIRCGLFSFIGYPF